MEGDSAESHESVGLVWRLLAAIGLAGGAENTPARPSSRAERSEGTPEAVSSRTGSLPDPACSSPSRHSNADSDVPETSGQSEQREEVSGGQGEEEREEVSGGDLVPEENPDQLPSNSGSNRDSETEGEQQGSRRKQKGKKQRKSEKRRLQEEESRRNVSSKKKPSMRTARDVINRIVWDENLPRDYFDIGYIDRFLGLVEKPFSAFTWGDLASMEWDVLAIPQHRIQYFKYRGALVWSRKERYDAVFGSSGTQEQILATMDRRDAELQLQVQPEARPGCGIFDDSDSDGEAGVQLTVEVGQQPTQLQVISAVPDQQRSTHFLAVRITDPQVRARAEHVQRAVTEREPELGACAMRPGLMHVTLCMLRLPDQEAVSAAADCVRSLVEDLTHLLASDSRQLRLRGLNTFGNRVLYVPVLPCDSFLAAVEEVRSRLRHVPGVTLTNAFEYVPHMTLVKVSRPVARARRSRFIDQASYQAHTGTDFGAQRFDNIHLCAIDADCALDGFYVTECSVTF